MAQLKELHLISPERVEIALKILRQIAEGRRIVAALNFFAGLYSALDIYSQLAIIYKCGLRFIHRHLEEARSKTSSGRSPKRIRRALEMYLMAFRVTALIAQEFNFASFVENFGK